MSTFSMMPGGYGRPVLVGPRRNRRKQIEMVRAAHVDRQADAFAKKSMMEDQFRGMMEKFGDKMPPELAEWLNMAAQMMMPATTDIPDLPSDAELLRSELENLAEQFSAHYFEQRPDGGWRLWDFMAIVRNAERVEKIAGSLAGSQGTRFVIQSNGEDTWTLESDVAIAFERFLHYTGVMLLEKAKIPCPNCADNFPQDCPECGGLGWILGGENAETA